MFPSETGESPLESCNWYRRVFKPACERAAVRNLRFHDLRHTFASRLAMTGAQQKVIQTLLGHKTPAMTDRYTHLSADSLRKAVERMGTATATATNLAQPPANAPQVAESSRATRRSRTGDLLITKGRRRLPGASGGWRYLGRFGSYASRSSIGRHRQASAW